MVYTQPVYSVSRPTIAKVYNQLQTEGYITKKKGLGTIVNHKYTSTTLSFGLLLPGAGESEIFSIINDQLLKQSEAGKFNCLWEGATASNANIYMFCDFGRIAPVKMLVEG